MGVMPGCLGGLTPICNSCGIKLCYEIDTGEYRVWRRFWDEWECPDCNPVYKFKRREVQT